MGRPESLLESSADSAKISTNSPGRAASRETTEASAAPSTSTPVCFCSSRLPRDGRNRDVSEQGQATVPKRTDIHKILIIGAGPIVIGQACEFDYSGTQACKALREEGFEVVLVNSNPATIMTDPDMADRTYIEPITVGVIEQILAIEKPDAVLPTLGGQTGSTSRWTRSDGALERHGCMLIGADAETIRKAEDRELFKQLHGGNRPGDRREALWPTTLMKLARSATRSACLACCGRALRWGAQEAASLTTAKNSTAWSRPHSSSARSIRS